MIPVLWVVTVAGASTLTWTVISAAGARVSGPVTVATSTSVETPGTQPTDAVRTSAGRGGRVTARCPRGQALSGR